MPGICQTFHSVFFELVLVFCFFDFDFLVVYLLFFVLQAVKEVSHGPEVEKISVSFLILIFGKWWRK